MAELVFAWTATCLVVGIGAVTQRRGGHIPNALTLPVLCIAPFVHVALGAPALLTAAAAVGGLAIAMPGYREGMWGGGAVKLFAAGCATAGVTASFVAGTLALVLYAAVKAYSAWRAPPSWRLDAPPIIAWMLTPGLVLDTLHALG